MNPFLYFRNLIKLYAHSFAGVAKNSSSYKILLLALTPDRLTQPKKINQKTLIKQTIHETLFDTTASFNAHTLHTT